MPQRVSGSRADAPGHRLMLRTLVRAAAGNASVAGGDKVEVWPGL